MIVDRIKRDNDMKSNLETGQKKKIFKPSTARTQWRKELEKRSKANDCTSDAFETGRSVALARLTVVKQPVCLKGLIGRLRWTSLRQKRFDREMAGVSGKGRKVERLKKVV